MFPLKTSPEPPEIVSHTSKNAPQNFLKNSLNSLFIEEGVIPIKNFNLLTPPYEVTKFSLSPSNIPKTLIKKKF